MIGRRDGDQGDSSRFEHAREFGRVARREHVEQHCHRFVSQVQPAVEVGDEEGGVLVALGRHAHRRLRQVTAEEQRVLGNERLSYAADVVALAAADFEHGGRLPRRPGRERIPDFLGEERAQRLEGSAIEEGAPRLKHVGRVAFDTAATVLRGEQVDVPFARDVE